MLFNYYSSILIVMMYEPSNVLMIYILLYDIHSIVWYVDSLVVWLRFLSGTRDDVRTLACNRNASPIKKKFALYSRDDTNRLSECPNITGEGRLATNNF